jgi:hypothetical protein
MFRMILSFILIVFLFSGLIGTANVFFKTSKSSDQTVIAQLSERKDKRLSIKEIESITSANNYSFTSTNALR